jgi:hypothetical protein
MGAVLLGTATAVFAQSAWLPAEREVKATPGFAYSTFDQFWKANRKLNDIPDRLDQYTGYLSLEYGILKSLAADASIGYTATSSDSFGPDGTDDGLMDTSLGLRYRLLDEAGAACPCTPTVSLRAGVVIPGTYDSNKPFSAGDGAHAFEGSLLFGKAIGHTGFGLYGDIGYRVREHPTPDDLFGSAGVFQHLGPVTLAAGYRHVQGLSGLNIEGAGFDPDAGRDNGFPALREVNQLVEFGVTYTDKGGRSYQLSFAKSVAGRNTGDKYIVGVNATFPFGGQ